MKRVFIILTKGEKINLQTARSRLLRDSLPNFWLSSPLMKAHALAGHAQREEGQGENMHLKGPWPNRDSNREHSSRGSSVLNSCTTLPTSKDSYLPKIRAGSMVQLFNESSHHTSLLFMPLTQFCAHRHRVLDSEGRSCRLPIQTGISFDPLMRGATGWATASAGIYWPTSWVCLRIAGTAALVQTTCTVNALYQTPQPAGWGLY